MIPKRSLSLVLSMLFACSFALAKAPKSVQVHGFITKVTSPYDFEVEGQRVTCTDATFTYIAIKDGWVKNPFKASEIHFGREIEVTGYAYDSNHFVAATSVMFGPEVGAQTDVSAKGIVLIEKPLEFRRDADGVSGTIFADGRRIRFTPQTHINFELNETERDAANTKPAPPGVRVSKYIRVPPAPMRSVEEVTPDVWVRYEGTTSADGAIDASRLMFRRNDKDRGKVAFWLEKENSIIEPDYKARKDGEVKGRSYSFKIVGDSELQEYVQKLGGRFVPEYQKNMAAESVDKLDRFYVIRNKRVMVATFPDGLVLPSTALIAKLKNEAQLAAILAHSVAEITQEHDYRRDNHNSTLKNSLLVGAIAAPSAGIPGVSTALWFTRYSLMRKYEQSLEAQADRISMEALLENGYDLREIAEMWRIFAGAWTDSTAKKLWYDTSNLQAHRPYVMSELSTRYVDVNYVGLKVDSPEFQKATSAVRSEANPR